jgi:hypothetical protein
MFYKSYQLGKNHIIQLSKSAQTQVLNSFCCMNVDETPALTRKGNVYSDVLILSPPSAD